MTKNDDFIGRCFTTPLNGVLTVIGKLPKVKNKTLSYQLTCSICSLDTELFPRDFECVKSSLEGGSIPCGCSKSPRLSQDQYKIIINRECKVRGYIFCGFDKAWCGNKTKLKMYCTKHNCPWNSTTIGNFLSGAGCTLCGLISNTKGDEFFIKDFMDTGLFDKNTVFKRNMKRKDSLGRHIYWDLTCKTCSIDEYVKMGLCDGVFTSTAGHLRKGQTPCRCSRFFHWSQNQREYQVNKLFEKSGKTFIGWKDNAGYKNNLSKITWLCKDGHNCNTSIANALSGTGCKQCFYASNNFGYFPERVEEEDNLYLLKFTGQCLDGLLEIFYKIGRAFDIDERIDYFPDHYQIELVASVQMTHQDVYNTEQSMHKQAAAYHYLPKIPFGGSKLECFVPSVLDIIDIHAE